MAMVRRARSLIRVPLLYSGLPMPSIDFAAVRHAVRMAHVLELLRFEPTERRGDQVRGPCPIHISTRPQSRSFSANLAKNTFRCFVCGAAGNQLDLWCQATRVSLFDATVDLCNRAGLSVPTLPGSKRGPRHPLNREEEPVTGPAEES